MNLKARDIMVKEVKSINGDCSVYKAVELLINSNINCLPVLDRDNCFIGIVTETDLLYVDKKLNPSSFYAYSEANIPINRRILKDSINELKSLKISQIMTTEVVSVDEDATIEELIDIIVNKGIKTIPVLKNNRLIGIVTRKNILKYYL
ncbi:CBS domain-containing protein [Alkaliphilus pronyensis]|uniref:CBS domain-containing protein n=1 Tax=Alkaliphilus pronyensis TaxID=1482732 RepID=A0A6I0FTZ7_9FIRM|nr:CBS domain-containing protein [Alkaliphilus pronyensis]KAB3539694.1 CBS domain-containing protein [Alkaliphilus pronyensis]